MNFLMEDCGQKGTKAVYNLANGSTMLKRSYSLQSSTAATLGLTFGDEIE